MPDVRNARQQGVGPGGAGQPADAVLSTSEHQPPLEATQHLPPMPPEWNDSTARVGFGASALETIGILRERRAQSADVEEPQGRRGKMGMIVPGAIAIVVAAVLLVTAITIRNANDEPGADDAAPAAVTEPVELISSAHIDVPGTAPNSRDWAGNTVTYDATNVTDGDPTTAWRTSGAATSEELIVRWDEAHTISELGLINGYAKVDKTRQNYNWYEINRRTLAVTWIFDDGTEISQELDETPQMQTITLDDPITTQSVRLRFDDVSSPAGKDFTALSEMTLMGE